MPQVHQKQLNRFSLKLTEIESDQIEQMSNMQNDSDSDLSVLSVETVQH